MKVNLADFGQYIVRWCQLYARDEARRIAANIAKLPELLKSPKDNALRSSGSSA